MTTNAEIQQAVTDRVMAQLRAGHIPWAKPWRYAGTVGGFPVNVKSRKEYRGINPWLLAIDAADKGFTSPWWGTFDQWAERCGMERRTNAKTGKGYWFSPDGEKRGVLKGQVGTRIVFSKTVHVRERDEATGKIIRKRVPMLRFWSVFNAEQCGMVPPKYLPGSEAWEPCAELAEPQAVADAYFANGGPTLVHSFGDRAGYNWATDVVRMPARRQFATSAAYYGALFHEACGHSTGHESRLNREPAQKLGNWSKGDPIYAREELTAQMASAMALAATGIESDDEERRSAAYIENWLTALENDYRLVTTAARAAQAALDLFMGRSDPYSEAEDEDQAEPIAA